MADDVFSEWFGAREPAGSRQDAPPPAADGHGQASPASINEPTEAADEPAQQPECAAVNWEEERVPNSAVDHARKLIARGCKLVPVYARTRKPVGNDWQNNATDNTEQVSAWLDAGYIYGVAGGHPLPAGGHLLIVDLDVKDGKDGIAELAKYGNAPETFTVRSPSGGLHLYFTTWDAYGCSPGGFRRLDEKGRDVSGIDIRGRGGHCVGPGCTRDGKPYEVICDAPIAEAPAWLVNRLQAAREHDGGNTIIGALDTPERIDAAKAALADPRRTPLSVEGQHGDDNLVKVVAQTLFDIGVSVDAAHELLTSHPIERDGRRGSWNALCSPPWSDDELLKKCHSAWTSRQDPVGSKFTAASEWSDAVTLDSASAPPPSSAGTPSPLALWSTGKFGKPFRLSDPIDPPEDYLYGLHYIRGIVSATAAPGGFGKSQFALGEAICMAAGRELLGERVYEPLRVWFVSLDDPGRITRKRARAFVRHHGLADADLDDRLVLDGNDTMPPAMLKLVTSSREGVRVDAATVNAFVAAIRARRVDVLILDPLIKFHAVEENDNPAMNEVGTTLAQIAIAANCAMEVLVHTSKPKGQRITAEHVRGASSFVDAARAVRVVNPMTEEEARRLGIDEAGRPWLFRVDLSKGNLAPPSEARWFKRVSVPIDNGTARMPDGEAFPAVAPYRLPDPVATTTEADVSKALAHLARGPDGAGSPWRASDKARWSAGVGIAEALGLDAGDPQTRVTCRKLIKDWLERGLLIRRVERNKAEGREVPLIHVPADWSERLTALRTARADIGDGPIAVEDPRRVGRASDFDDATTIQRKEQEQ
jgi:hypothetical protein